MINWRTKYENDRLRKKTKTTLTRFDFEVRITKILEDIEKLKTQANLLKCDHDFALAKAAVKDLRMTMQSAKIHRKIDETPYMKPHGWRK